MASTQKKKGGSRLKSSTGKRGSSKTSNSRGKKNSAGGRRGQAPAKQPIRRELGALACLLLAIFTAFGYFGTDGIFIAWFCGLVKGLFGYGFLLLPPVLLLAAYILMFHRGSPLRLRLTCTLLLPAIFSCLLPSLLLTPLAWDGRFWGTLMESGMALKSGGVLCGTLAQIFVMWFTRIGSTILFALVGVIVGLTAFHKTVTDLVNWFIERPRYEYEEEPEPVHRKTRREESREEYNQPRRAAHAQIDIPVDDGPFLKEEIPEPKPKKKSFFDRTPRVPTPDSFFEPESEIPEPELESEPETELILQPSVSAVDPVMEPQVEEPIQTVEPVKPEPVPVVEEIQKTKEEESLITQNLDQAIEQGVVPYQYPPLSLLKEGDGDNGSDALGELNSNRQRLSDTIRSFGIEANIVNVVRGPSVTRYELELDQGVRLNKLTNLSDDIALALGATGVRIAPIPDKISVVGIEVPNKVVSPVSIHSVIGSTSFTASKSKASFAVGKDISGDAIIGDIGKLPHLLIAGTTGSGKSVCTNSLIISLLYKATPEEVRLIMVDPKMVELGIYNGIPHLLIPVVTDPKKAAGALQWAVTEMMKRYRTFSEVGVRKLEEYNALASRTDGMEKMPIIVVVIDELADLMLVAAKEVEESICRVAQMGRAAGMHLVIATQRPSADVITGLMKANIPSRIAFAVASAMESRIILDTQGAEKLVGRGDMLFAPLGSGKPTRVQGCFISDNEVASVVGFVKQNSGIAQYDDEVMQEIEQRAAEKEKGSKGVGGTSPDDVCNEYDELIDAAAEVVVETGQASVSMLQRRLKLGYARAARLVDQLEEKGIVGPFEGSKPRQLLITKEQWQEMKYRQGGSSVPGGTMSNKGNATPITDTLPFDQDEALDRTEEDML